MLVPLMLYGGLTVLELGVLLAPVRRSRRVAAGLLVPPVLAASAWLYVDRSNIWMLLVLVLACYRATNLLRITAGQINEKRLRQVGFRASAWLIVWQLAMLALWRLSDALLILPSTWWFVVAVLQVAVAGLLCFSVLRHIWTTRPPQVSAAATMSAELPTVTVAIPARNETEDLEACLAALVASDYPKLEILVLDDCSQNKHTPEIIRSYAHAGVRFLQGEVPPDDWLAKNFAYEQLYRAASGEMIVFCGVDVRLQPASLRLLVAAAHVKSKSMVSVLPQNLLPRWPMRWPITMVQTMRYAWELALPRRFFDRPPVLSTCWLVRRDLLAAAGGFGAVRNSIQPESYFAKAALQTDGYSFMRSSSNMAVLSRKSLHEQHTTAVRTEYPRLRRRLELVGALSLVQVLSTVGPYVFLAWALLGLAPSGITIPSSLSVALLTLMYASVAMLTYRRWLLRSLAILPIASLLDIILLHESMVRYEFFEVVWKERNICMPVMQRVRASPGQPVPQLDA